MDEEVLAKFKLVKAQTDDNPNPEHPIVYNLELSAVTDGSPENKEFFKWTPGGQIFLGTMNEKAAALFLSGAKEFYVIFRKAS
jgi:hypothetical protein